MPHNKKNNKDIHYTKKKNSSIMGDIDIGADIVMISGCEDHQTSADGMCYVLWDMFYFFQALEPDRVADGLICLV